MKDRVSRDRLNSRLLPVMVWAAVVLLLCGGAGAQNYKIADIRVAGNINSSEQMIRNTGSELLLMLGDQDLEPLRDHILQADKRGIVVGALLTGISALECGQVARHPPLESQLQELTGALVMIADSREALIASTDSDVEATITSNPNLVLIARQFIWMELFTQRIAAQLGTDLLQTLAPEDRRVFEGFLATAQ